MPEMECVRAEFRDELLNRNWVTVRKDMRPLLFPNRINSYLLLMQSNRRLRCETNGKKEIKYIFVFNFESEKIENKYANERNKNMKMKSETSVCRPRVSAAWVVASTDLLEMQLERINICYVWLKWDARWWKCLAHTVHEKCARESGLC